jgi:hypothetical protein
MPIREYTPDDLAVLRSLHAAQNFDYAFPDLADPLFLTKLVLEETPNTASSPTESRPPSPNPSDWRGSISAAVLLRLTCEAYLLLDPHSGTPSERWSRVVALQEAATRDAYARGLSDAHCWLPPRIARRFGRRLAALGWLRDDTWTPFCKKL